MKQIFFWGVLLMAQAASRNFTDLAVLRILSGAAEATADPAFVLITATWYTRAQQPTRIGYWYMYVITGFHSQQHLLTAGQGEWVRYCPRRIIRLRNRPCKPVSHTHTSNTA